MQIPYTLQAAVDIETRRNNIKHAISLNLPRLEQTPIDDAKILNIACYGPSLRDTWQELKHPILSMSGATRFLAQKGIIADYHIDIDPRPHKVKHITPPISGVTYLIASVCDRQYFDALKQEKVIMWHLVSSNEEDDSQWLSQYDPNAWIISTGSNVGLAALQIGGFLGYRKYEIHGMDASFSPNLERHSGEHFGKVQEPNLSWDSMGKTYKTNKVMVSGAVEVVNSVRLYPILCIFYGEGLIQSLIEENNFPNACRNSDKEKCEKLRRSTINFIDTPNPVSLRISSSSVWESIGALNPNPIWIEELQLNFKLADQRRDHCSKVTGSISLETGLLLKVLCNWFKPSVIAEIGTYIGKSTTSMFADKIYTCDKDNDCLNSTDKIITYAKQTSTQMMRDLVNKSIRVDLLLFDGRIQNEDLPLIKELSHSKTIYVFDDYCVNGKGVDNILKLAPELSEYSLVEPYSGFKNRTTLAFLAPLSNGAIS